MIGDRQLALSWYRRARDLGDTEAAHGTMTQLRARAHVRAHGATPNSLVTVKNTGIFIVGASEYD